VHRIGWLGSQLDGLARGAPLRARLPLVGRVEGERYGPVTLRIWRELFAGLERHAAALGVA
jgi:hypothetical protein